MEQNENETIQEDLNLKAFTKKNFNGLHYKHNYPNLNLNVLEDEFKTLLNDFSKGKHSKIRKIQTIKVLNNILKIKYSVSTKYIKSFFNSGLKSQQKRNKLLSLSKNFKIENKTQFQYTPKSYFLWNFEKVTYGYNKKDFIKNDNGTTKQLFNKENVCIKKIKVLPTLKQQNRIIEIVKFRNFLSN